MGFRLSMGYVRLITSVIMVCYRHISAMICFKRQWRAIIALISITLLTLVSTNLTFATVSAVSPIQLSTDPYTNSSSQHQTEVEPDIFSFGTTLVSAFEVGRFAGTTGGSTNIGWATSTNGGRSWTHGFLSGITIYAGGSFARTTAPSVVYDAKHKVWLIASQGFYSVVSGGGAAMLVSRSTDGGLSWSQPVTVTNLGSKVLLDKGWITCDNTASSPFYGHCYDEFDNHSQGNLILMNTSTDGGMTWQGAKSTANKATGLGGQPLVQPNGTVVVPMDDVVGTAVLVFTSTDGGGSWGTASIIQQITSHKVPGDLRSRPLISASIDGAGNVYVAWQDCRFVPHCAANQIVFLTLDTNIIPSAVQRISIHVAGSSLPDFFIPGFGVDPATSGNTAHIGLVYYYYPDARCTHATCQLNVGFTSSTDGGKTFTDNVQLAGPMKLPWLPQSEFGFMVGDYTATTFSSGNAYPVFAVASTPASSVFCSSPGTVCHEAIFTVSGGLNPLMNASPSIATPIIARSVFRIESIPSPAYYHHNTR